MRQFAASRVWPAGAMSCTVGVLMRNPTSLMSCAAVLAAAWIPAWSAERPASAIQDNSFFVEEAYNQERGVVQHIFNGVGSVTQLSGSDDRQWDLSFTQEWPVGSQTHQFSYTILYSAGDIVDGFGDVALNYRYQALYEDEDTPAFAPRFSVILPTGDEDEGRGFGEVGYQVNLPVSRIVSDRWTVHGNAGGTVFPGASGSDPRGAHLGASAIYAVSEEFNLMLEAISQWAREPDGSGGSEHSTTTLLSPGLRKAINLASAQMVLGLAVPIGLTSESPDYGIFLYFSYEHAFLPGVSMP